MRPLTVGLATTTPFGDRGFNDEALGALLRFAAETGGRTLTAEALPPDRFEEGLAALAQRADLVWAMGSAFTAAVDRVAAGFPRVSFAIIDAAVPRPNVASVIFRDEEGAFLMGILAARASRARRVGFVGGEDIPVIHHFEAGFRAGVLVANPCVRVLAAYTGTFGNRAAGREAAQALFAAGADVLFHAAGAAGLGVIEAARDMNRLAIGVDIDQSFLAPAHALSSMIKHVDLIAYLLSMLAARGRFPGGVILRPGLRGGGVGPAPSTRWELAPGARALVQQWTDAIKAGRATVPVDRDRLVLAGERAYHMC